MWNLFKYLVIIPELLGYIAALDEFKGRWQALSQMVPERLAALRHIATIESVGFSTRIEGARLSDAEVETLLKHLEGGYFRSRDEQEVAGYAEVMELIFESYTELPLTENHLQQLYGILLKYAEKDAYHRGYYKKFNNHVEAFDAAGNSLGVIFQTATTFETPGFMEQLVGWTQLALQEARYHPLLRIAVFILLFLAIHPFQDGNGRLSRALTTPLLLQSGYDYVPYSSLERVVEENKDNYYRTLRRAQSTLDRDEANLNQWILFFLEMLIVQKNGLLRKMEREKLFAPFPPLSEALLQIAREQARVTPKIAVQLTGANRNTIKAHLKQLVHQGALRRQGKGKGTWYTIR